MPITNNQNLGTTGFEFFSLGHLNLFRISDFELRVLILSTWLKT
jgi:hypothetical protein